MKKASILSTLLLFSIQEIKPIDYKKLTFATAILGLTYLFITNKKNQTCSKLIKQDSSQTAQKTSSSDLAQSSSNNQPIPTTFRAHNAEELRSQNVTIYSVLQQHDSTNANLWTNDFWKAIYDQAESTNCGYHALKNAIAILQNKSSFRQDIESVRYYQETALPWIKEIQNLNTLNNSSYPLGNMLTGSDIEHLIKKFMPDQESNISVVDTFEIFDDAAKSSNKEVAVLKKLSQQCQASHAFIVNTSALQKAKLHSGFHWVVYFLKKSLDGEISITYRDSLTTINPMIAKKIKHLCLSKKQFEEKFASFQEAIHIAPLLAKIEVLKNQITDHDYYLYQKHAIANVSLGLLEFKNLKLADNVSPAMQTQIEQTFEANFSQPIAACRKTRTVKIDGAIHEELTRLHQTEILKQLPAKLRLFTLWKQNKNNGKWHIRIDTITDSAQANFYLQQYQQQFGTMPLHSKDLILQNNNINTAAIIKQIFCLIEQMQQYPWSLHTSKSIISICEIITNHGICNGELEYYRQNIYAFLKNIQKTIQETSKANSQLYEIYEILKKWNDTKNPIIQEMCKDIERLQPEQQYFS